MKPERGLAHLRRVILFFSVAAALYGFARFDVVLLPLGALSPLYGIHAGDRLLVDRHARDGRPGEDWLYRDDSGALLLGRSMEPPPELTPEARAAMAEGALWLEFEREVPGLADSRALGPIRSDARVGRVLFVLPW